MISSSACGSVDVGLRVFDLLGRGRRRLDDRRRVAGVGALQRHGDNRAGLQIDRMLGLVGQMRAAIFHLRDLRIRIVRVRPVFVRRLLLALPIQPRQVLPRRRLDARGLREPRQKLLIVFSRIAPHDAAHRRIGFERRRIDRHRLALEQPGLGQPLLDPREDGAMGLQIDQPSRARNRRVIGRPLHPTPGAETGGSRASRPARHAMPRSESMPSK